MTKNSNNILNLLLTTFLISASITSCQTTSAAGTKETVKVLDAQVLLVEAVLKERETQKVQDAVKDNADLAKAKFYDITELQLRLWACKYHELFLGKPSGDFYIDDKGINSDEFFAD
jgi:hypothetical protein